MPMPGVEPSGGGGGMGFNPIPYLGVGGMILGGIGGFQQMNQQADAIRSRNNAGANIWDYLNLNGIPSGTSWPLLQAGMYPLLDMAGGMSAGNFIPDYWRQGLMGQGDLMSMYRGMLPGMMTPGQIGGAGSYLDSNVQPHMDASQQLLQQLFDPAYNNFNSFGSNPFSQNMIDQSMFGMNNPYAQTQNDYGAALLRGLGRNDYNTAGMDLGLFNMRNGGQTDQTRGLFNMGGQGAGAGLDMFSSMGMNPLTMGAYGAGMQGVNTGMGMINNAQQLSAAYMPELQRIMGYGFGGMEGQYGQSPESFLGPRGTAALDALGMSQNIPQSFNSVNNFMSQATQNNGYTPQGQTLFNQSLPRAFQDMDLRNSQITDDRNVALRMANGGMDALPSWFAPFVQSASQMMGSGGSLGGGFNIPTISAGGGGGGASAGSMSRDLGPDYQKALEEFNKDPLLPMNQVLSMARDQAATAASGQANRIARLAEANGRMGPVTASGMANQAQADFADQALQAEAAALREALMGQQGLKLQRSGQQGQMAQAIGGLNANMNIADAGNQTQASIANSQAASQAAGQALQAQIANASNSLQGQLAMAQLQSGLFNNLLNTASTSRGQNLQSQIAGLNALPQMQQNANQRDAMLFNMLSDTGSQANQRFGMGGNALGVLPALNQNNTDRYATMLNPLVAGQQTGTQRGNTFAGIGQNALTGMGNTVSGLMQGGIGLYGQGQQGLGNALQGSLGYTNAGTGMFGQGGNMMGGAISGANQNFANNAGLFGSGMQDAFNWGNLGNTAMNGGQGNMLGFLGAGINATGQQLVYGTESGRLGAGLGQNIGRNALDLGNLGLLFGNLDLGNRTAAGNMMGGFMNASNSQWDPFFRGVGAAQSPYTGIMDNMIRYMTAAGPGSIGTYGNMFSLNGAPQNPFGGFVPSFNYNMGGN